MFLVDYVFLSHQQANPTTGPVFQYLHGASAFLLPFVFNTVVTVEESTLAEEHIFVLLSGRRLHQRRQRNDRSPGSSRLALLPCVLLFWFSIARCIKLLLQRSTISNDTNTKSIIQHRNGSQRDNWFRILAEGWQFAVTNPETWRLGNRTERESGRRPKLESCAGISSIGCCKTPAEFEYRLAIRSVRATLCCCKCFRRFLPVTGRKRSAIFGAVIHSVAELRRRMGKQSRPKLMMSIRRSQKKVCFHFFNQVFDAYNFSADVFQLVGYRRTHFFLTQEKKTSIRIKVSTSILLNVECCSFKYNLITIWRQWDLNPGHFGDWQ